MAEPKQFGLIAGEGAFPLEVARCAVQKGERVTCVALRDMADPEIEQLAARTVWIYPGEVGTGLAAFREEGVRDVVMAGKVQKRTLFQGEDAVRLDDHASGLMERLADRNDDTILGVLVQWLESSGLRLLAQYAHTPELLVGEGVLTKAQPSEAQRADIAFGFPIAKTLGDLDIGQTVVVKDRAVLALEAIEGTDAAVRRAGEFAEGACVVKVAKPSQDPRFDVPTIGPDTLAVLREARASVLAFEAGATVVLERERLVTEADAAGIVLVGVAAGDSR